MMMRKLPEFKYNPAIDLELSWRTMFEPRIRFYRHWIMNPAGYGAVQRQYLAILRSIQETPE
jgi:hypothetical protein